MITDEHSKRHSTVYQIQCETQNKGKRVASSKRRIRWRFGFANADALRQGQHGKDCRGAEHEVVFVWSLNSGKQLILADGNEVHWAKSGRKEKLEVAWDMHGNHTLKVVAEPKRSKKGEAFDLWIDGISFSQLPSIYELGNPNDHDLPNSSNDLPPLIRRQASRSHSMPDLLNLTTPTPTPSYKTTRQQQQQYQQQSPTSSMDMIVFDQGVEVQFQQPQPQQPVYTFADTPQQAYRHSWQAAPSKRDSLSSCTSTGSTNPFDAGYSTPTKYDSDWNDDSPLSSALRSLGVELDQDSESVTSLSLASNPFDFVPLQHQPSVQTYLPNLMVPQRS